MTEAGIALGSNLGDRLAHLRYGRDELATHPRITLRDVSTVYQTAAVDCPPGSAPFLNAVILVRTDLPPEDLLAFCHGIENQAGRLRLDGTPLNAPRPLDLDLLFFGDRRSNDPGLILPHPRLHQRRFVLQPLAELIPDRILPGLSSPVQSLLVDLSDSEEPAPQPFSEEW